MAGLLGEIYSAGDRMKRRLTGLLADPIGSIQQTAGLLGDFRNEDADLNRQAFANPANPLQVTDQKAMGLLADRTLAGPLSFAPLGATYYRNSRGPSPDNGAGYMMFADSPERIGNYGRHAWQFDDKQFLPNEILDAGSKEAQREIARALLKDKASLRELGVHPKQLAQEANPADIVNSAGLWDNPGLVETLWDHLLAPKGYKMVRTSDGALLFDPNHVQPRAAQNWLDE